MLQLDIQPRKIRATEPVVLRGSEHGIACKVFRPDGARDRWRRPIREVANAERNVQLVGVVVACRYAVPQLPTHPDDFGCIGQPEVGEDRILEPPIGGRAGIETLPVVRPVAAFQAGVQDSHPVRISYRTREVVDAESAGFRATEHLLDVLHRVGELSIQRQLAEREVLGVIHLHVVAAVALLVHVDIGGVHRRDVVRIGARARITLEHVAEIVREHRLVVAGRDNAASGERLDFTADVVVEVIDSHIEVGERRRPDEAK